MPTNNFWTEASVISTYTRAQAIEDGVLIDVSETALEAGILHPVALTTHVWHKVIVPDDRLRPYGQSEEGRLWDCVWMLRCAAKTAPPGTSVMQFKVIAILKERQRRLVSLKAICGPGNNDRPVITISFPEES